VYACVCVCVCVCVSHCVCLCVRQQQLHATLVSVAKVMRCIQCSLVRCCCHLQESFISVKSWIDDLRKLADPLVIVVVGNKSDLAEQRRVDLAGACESCCFRLEVCTGTGFQSHPHQSPHHFIFVPTRRHSPQIGLSIDHSKLLQNIKLSNNIL